MAPPAPILDTALPGNPRDTALRLQTSAARAAELTDRLLRCSPHYEPRPDELKAMWADLLTTTAYLQNLAAQLPRQVLHYVSPHIGGGKE